jgi:hypothetical protein
MAFTEALYAVAPNTMKNAIDDAGTIINAFV